MVEAADLFNASQYRRTVGGIAKSLGDPTVSVVVLSGVNSEVVVTVAWDISWYQYRVTPDRRIRSVSRSGATTRRAGGVVHLVERAHDRGRQDRARHRTALDGCRRPP